MEEIIRNEKRVREALNIDLENPFPEVGNRRQEHRFRPLGESASGSKRLAWPRLRPWPRPRLRDVRRAYKGCESRARTRRMDCVGAHRRSC